MLQNAPNCTIKKKNYWGSIPPNPLANAWLRQPLKKLPPLANPAYANGLLLINLFEGMRS